MGRNSLERYYVLYDIDDVLVELKTEAEQGGVHAGTINKMRELLNKLESTIEG